MASNISAENALSSYALFNATDIKSFIINQLSQSDNPIFSGCSYLGSNMNALIDVLAVMSQQILFHFSVNTAESSFATANLFESMNKLASKVEQVSNEHDYKTFLITSSLENEGKSSVAVNLAISLAKNKHKVLLVDGDMKKPALHKIFEKEVDKSLVDVLDKNESWQDCIVSLEREQIDVIFSCADDESQEMLAEKFGEFINKVKEEYEYIIVDSAPSRYIQDTTMIASLCDATFVVVQQNNATCKVINDTIYYLVNNNANVIGTIYNASVFDFMKAQNFD